MVKIRSRGPWWTKSQPTLADRALMDALIGPLLSGRTGSWVADLDGHQLVAQSFGGEFGSGYTVVHLPASLRGAVERLLCLSERSNADLFGEVTTT